MGGDLRTIPSPRTGRQEDYKSLAGMYAVCYGSLIRSLYPPMIPGLNTNVNHGGIEYHVQTEDLGRENPHVLTLVFRAGAIIARKKVNYQDVLGEGAPEAEIKRFMEEQHDRIIQAILGSQPQKPAPSPPATTKPSPPQPAPAPPKPSLPPADKSLDELIADYLRSRNPPKPR